MADRFNARRLRRRLAVLAAAVVVAAGAIGLLPAQHAAAQDSCQPDDAGRGWICQWSQLDNNNWPDQSSTPDCGQTCDWYLHGNCQYYYYSDQVNFSTNSVDFRGDIERAVRAWSGRPYCSPTFYNCKCGSAFLTLASTSLSGADAGYCGVGWTTTAWEANNQQGDNHVVGAEAEYNTTASDPWFDGPPSDYSGMYCDAIMTSLHEVGHTMTESHSSYPDDIMCAGANVGCKDVNAIDADADSMLNAVYGPYHNANNGGGSGGCGGCNMACPQTTGVTTSTGTDPATTVNATIWTVCGTAFALPDVSGYWAKTWDIFQGVSTPNIPADLTTSPCWQYYLTHQLVAWITCSTGVNPK